MSYNQQHQQAAGMLAGVYGFSIFTIAAFAIGAFAYAQLGSHDQFLFPIVAALFLGVITPVTFIAIRHQVRLTRIKLINLFAEAFDLSKKNPLDEDDRDRESKTLLSFEFVKGKYYVDLDLKEHEEPKLRSIPKFPMMLHTDWMLLICAMPYIVFSSFGAFLLFSPIVNILDYDGLIKLPLWPSLLTIGGSPTDLLTDDGAFKAYHANTLTIAALAFAGAYFYSMRLLLRAVAVFDLSPVTFLRCFSHLVLAILLAVVIYRVFPSAEGAASFINETTKTFGFGTNFAAGATFDPELGVNAFWLILSFALGFVPDSALEYALKKSGLTFKPRYSLLERHAPSIPLTIIDGVDPYIAFRMEEANIYDVQNLATFNPIMLHIESPFGIYQTVDWVAQAQLCSVVGPERFLALKMINIRTIFDLERAARTKGVEDELVRLVGGALMMDCRRDAECREAFAFRGVSAFGQGDAGDLDLFRKGMTVAAVKRLVWLIVDDLHVHRLRQIWTLVWTKLDPKNASFDHIDDRPSSQDVPAEDRPAEDVSPVVAPPANDQPAPADAPAPGHDAGPDTQAADGEGRRDAAE